MSNKRENEATGPGTDRERAGATGFKAENAPANEPNAPLSLSSSTDTREGEGGRERSKKVPNGGKRRRSPVRQVILALMRFIGQVKIMLVKELHKCKIYPGYLNGD